jgi:hypothetical protein
VSQEVLHARARSAGEGAMGERLVLRSFLADDHHFRGAVEATPEEHRAVVPAEGLLT